MKNVMMMKKRGRAVLRVDRIEQSQHFILPNFRKLKQLGRRIGVGYHRIYSRNAMK